MSRSEFDIYVEMEVDETDDLVSLTTGVEEGLESTGLIGPALAINRYGGFVSLVTQLVAKDLTDAVDAVVVRLGKALGYSQAKARSRAIRVEASPFLSTLESELVSRAEISRRLGLSPVRIHDLSRRADFPSPKQMVDSKRPLYLWGDVVKWQQYRLEHSKPGRPRKAEVGQ